MLHVHYIYIYLDIWILLVLIIHNLLVQIVSPCYFQDCLLYKCMFFSSNTKFKQSLLEIYEVSEFFCVNIPIDQVEQKWKSGELGSVGSKVGKLGSCLPPLLSLSLALSLFLSLSLSAYLSLACSYACSVFHPRMPVLRNIFLTHE